jgi:hypothetical protein
VLNREATNTNFIAFGLMQLGLKSMILILYAISVQLSLIFNGHHWNKLKLTTLENVALATRRSLIGKHNSCFILQQCFTCDLHLSSLTLLWCNGSIASTDMDQIMYINERIKDIEDIQNGITVEHVVLYDKIRIFSCD